ncbi:hypothetical protein CRE_23361 [Caenorhabditis remanei]|uniref:Uncharacterized protein n=1 Tax=Caenorhabditis remanei TaxID=31234 RepID=E3MH28_CAERE|nr:hypothetical protein CRE_23361 [Caenorhabditis remanei]
MRKFIAYKLMIYAAYLFSLFIVVSTTYLRSIGYSKRVEYIVVTYFITQTTLLLFSGIFLAFRSLNQKPTSSENHMVTQIIVLAVQKCIYIPAIFFLLGFSSLEITACKIIDMLIIPVTIQLTYLGCHYKDYQFRIRISKVGSQKISTISMSSIS